MDYTNYTIWADTKSVSRIYFTSLDKLFSFMNNEKFKDEVICGYIGWDYYVE